MIANPVKAGLALAALIFAAQSMQAQTVTPAMRLPDGRVDTTKPGMRTRIYRGTSALTPNNVVSAESYISGMPFNPGNLAPINNMPNSALLNFDQDNEFYERPWWVYQFVNFHDQVDPSAGTNPTGGNFSTAASAPHNVADVGPVPGLPVGGADYYVVEFTGWLDLRAGTTRFGVNSDDGFRLTIGSGTDLYAMPSGTTPAGVQLTVLDGTRGFGNTEANITVTQAGFYPFRLIWWEATGGTAGCEFFTFGPGATSGNRFLVGDTSQANAVRVYYSITDMPAQITGRFPLAGATGVAARPDIRAILENGKSPIDQASITVTVDGTPVPFSIGPSPEGSTTNVKIDTTPGAVGPFLPGTSHTVVIAGRDSSDPAVPFTHTWSFTTANYPTVPADYSVGSVDTEKPGFKAKVVQTQTVNTGPQTSQSWAAERRYAHGFNDPATGLPFPNVADLTNADANGYFTDADVINWNQAAPAGAGSFMTGDELIPGVPVGVDERYTYSVETILQLPAGIYRLGVNSDDGFRLTAGRGPADVTGIEIAVANADRGPTDTYGDVNIPADGFYPFRVMWWETGGGAAAEFFLVSQSGEKILINDVANAGAIRAFRESANTPPHVSRVLPVVNEPYAFADQDVIIELTEQSLPVNADSIVLKINNVVQNITKSTEGNVTRIVRDSTVDYLLPSGANSVVLTYGYGTTTVDAAWSFNVPAYTRVIPAGNRVPAANVTGSGFTLHQVNHLHRGGTDQGQAGRYIQNGGGANNWPGPEIQLARGYLNLAGDPFANNSRAPYNAGPSIDNAFGIINFNTTSGVGTGNTGYLNGDTRVPFDQSEGNVGTGTGTDNFVQEWISYIDLKAGSHIFAVNPDDGFTMHSSPNPRDTLGTLLGWKPAPGGQAGFPLANNNVTFNVIVPEDGIYPFRLLYWEGGGDTRVEFMALDRNTGRLSAVNNSDANAHNPTQPGAPLPPYTPYVAYSTYTGPVRPWTKFSAYPIRNETSFFNNPIQQTGPGPITLRLPGNTSYAGIANDSITQRPFGDAVGAIIADAGDSEIGLIVDGERVNATVTTLPNGDKEVKFTPSAPLAPGVQHTAGLIYAGVTNWWSFTTINQVEITGVPRPVGDAIPANRGFLAKVAQTTAARTGANSGNSVASAEAQLAAGPGIATPNANRPDGRYIVPGILNMNINKNLATPGADLGNFTAARSSQADDPFPGLATGNNLNFSVEYFAWLELPAGYQKFGWGGDDGFAITVGMPDQTDGQVLFSVDRGAGERDLPFAFVAPAAGLYPVRLVFYQGGGGGNLELFTYGPGGTKVPVNDPNNPAAIKAYYEIAGGVLPEPVITFSFANGLLTINWNNGGTLESSSAATGAVWTSTGATGNPNGTFQVTIPAGTGAAFYRVTRPQ